MKATFFGVNTKYNSQSDPVKINVRLLFKLVSYNQKNGRPCQISFTAFFPVNTICVRSGLRSTSQWHRNPTASAYS